MRIACDVNQQVAQRAVHDPRGHVSAKFFTVLLYLCQRNFKLVNLVVARFVHSWCLAGGANEHAAEQVAQAGVVVPIQDERSQQFRLAQKRAVRRCGSAHDDVVASARASVAAVGHEFLG